MKEINLQEMKEIIQSSNLNFLIGAGLSRPFLPVLTDIEKRLVQAKSEAAKITIYKEYFTNVMLPNKDIINGGKDLKGTNKNNYDATHTGYKDFFKTISAILLKRKSTLLSKQANIFTTNIDIFMEKALEECNIEYNDGFSGRLNPIFRLSNFKKSISKRSLHFENVSEIPIFNLAKMHGSLTWAKDAQLRAQEQILFSKLEQIEEVQKAIETEKFDAEYKKLLIINPEKIKFEETVITLTYYELLRMYSSELEKEGSVLFVTGFSMADEHIREITVRCANSNPTLKVYIFCYTTEDAVEMNKKINPTEIQYNNIEVVEPRDENEGSRYDIKKLNEEIFKQIKIQTKE